MKNILSPSILAADFNRLGEQIQAAAGAGAEYMHIDVMDGAFVPSISFGMPVLSAVNKECPAVMDVHLMIEDPDRYLEEFVKCGADIITVHAEACRHLDRTIAAIHDLGAKAGVALNPSTPLSVLDWVLPQVDMVLIMSVNPGFGGQTYIPYATEKIRQLRRRIEELGLHTDIEVDGGVKLTNVKEVLEAGANVIVAGSAVFKDDIAGNVKSFLEIMGEKTND